MASPLLAIIGAITLVVLGVVAFTALVVWAVQGGLMLARYINGVSKAIVNALTE